MNLELEPQIPGILLVEDEECLNDLLHRFLSQEGFRVFTARNGYEALETFHRETLSISLLFTDINMPGMNGFQLAREIQHLDPEIQILFTSGGCTENPDEIKFLYSHSFLMKPYPLSALKRKVNQLLQKKKQPLTPILNSPNPIPT